MMSQERRRPRYSTWLFWLILARLQLGGEGGGLRAVANDRGPNWGRRRQNTGTKMSTSEAGAIMWRCGAVLSDSNRRVLSHLYTMFAFGGRLFLEIVVHSFNTECSKWAQRYILQSKANIVERPLDKWAITTVVHMSHIHVSQQLGPTQTVPCCAIQLDCLLN